MSEAITPVELAAYASLKQAIVAIRLNLGKHVRDLTGMSLVQFEILLILEQSPDGMRMHEIADAIGISRSGLTYQVGQMEEAGLVRRSGEPGNSRAVLASLTEAGRERVSEVQDQHFAFVRRRALGVLDEGELEMLSAILTRIAESARADAAADG